MTGYGAGRAGLAGLVMLAVLGACAPAVEYTRPDTAVAQRDKDEQECLDIGQEQALDESFASGPKYPPYRYTQFVADADSDGGGGGLTASFGLRGARVYELTKYCMEQRGYKLVPKPK